MSHRLKPSLKPQTGQSRRNAIPLKHLTTALPRSYLRSAVPICLIWIAGPLIAMCFVTVVEDMVIFRGTAALQRTGTTFRKTSNIYCYESTMIHVIILKTHSSNVHKFPLISVNQCDVDSLCLVDTGSVVSTKIAKCLLRSLKAPLKKYLSKKCMLQLKAANGLAIPYIGQVEFDVNYLGNLLNSEYFSM